MICEGAAKLVVEVVLTFVVTPLVVEATTAPPISYVVLVLALDHAHEPARRLAVQLLASVVTDHRRFPAAALRGRNPMCTGRREPLEKIATPTAIVSKSACAMLPK